MIWDLIILVASFAFLYHGAKWIVTGASKIAACLNISKVVVGVVLVAFGTSAPELFVNIIAACRGHSEIALSNVSGSNLANICVGYSLCALLGGIVIDKKKFGTDLIYFCLAPAAVLFFLAVYPGGNVPVWAIIFFVVPFAFYIASTKKRMFNQLTPPPVSKRKLGKAIAIFGLGVMTLYFSGEMVIRSATQISIYFGISESIIALTFIAVGTSLPDIMASLVAVKRKENSIAVGNILGSNIFNILLVLTGSLVFSARPLIADNAVSLDYLLVLAISVGFVISVWKRPKLGRIRGGILFGIYLAYMLMRFLVIK